MSTAERLAADLAQVGFEQAEAAARGDWDAVTRHDQTRRTLLEAMRAITPTDSPEVRASLASAQVAARQVEQAFRIARPALTAEMRRQSVGAAAGRAYGSAGSN